LGRSTQAQAAIKSAGLETEIWAYDHNTDQPEYPQQVIDASNGTVSTVAWHCYTDNPWPPLTAFHNANPRVKQYMTECWLHLATGEGFFELPGFVSGPIQNFASGAMAWTLGACLLNAHKVPMLHFLSSHRIESVACKALGARRS
jgi:glucosylceramidase